MGIRETDKRSKTYLLLVILFGRLEKHSSYEPVDSDSVYGAVDSSRQSRGDISVVL